MTEHKIQNHIWDNRENWEDFIIEVEFPPKFSFDDSAKSINSLSPYKVIYNQIIERLEKLYQNSFGIKLFGCEVPLRKQNDSTIRADLLGAIDGISGIAVVEIKKSFQTERQAYTELLAYASHIRSVFPMMSREDTFYLLIAPMEERIVREATIQSLIFDENPVFAFIPIWENEDITTLKLKPWIPDVSEIVKISESTFSEKNFDVFKLCWDKIEGWNADVTQNPSDFMVQKMDKISSYAAQLMESKGIHGFVFCSQRYPELPLLPNALVIVGINPFKVAKSYFLLKNGTHIEDFENNGDVVITDLIPELKNKAENVNKEYDFLHHLTITWGNTLCRIAFNSFESMTSNTKGDFVDYDYGEFDWELYQKLPIEHVHCFNYGLKSTGIIRKLFIAYTLEDYKFLEKFGYEEHPSLSHGDIPTYTVDYFAKHFYFNSFLRRLFYPN